jgi:hypothetical protein
MHAVVAIKDGVRCFVRLFRVSGIRQVAKCLRNVTFLERSLVSFPSFTNRHYFKNRVKIKNFECASLLFT